MKGQIVACIPAFIFFRHIHCEVNQHSYAWPVILIACTMQKILLKGASPCTKRNSEQQKMVIATKTMYAQKYTGKAVNHALLNQLTYLPYARRHAKPGLMKQQPPVVVHLPKEPRSTTCVLTTHK